MQPLDKTLRRHLERTVREARDVAEAAAQAALGQIGASETTPYSHLTEQARDLRRRLRAHGRQLGDNRQPNGEQATGLLVEKIAYEHWHRMLFARFLAENDLLMYPDPDDPIAVSLEECEDLAAEEGAANGWELAARFAARMLPQIFRIDSPVFELTPPPPRNTSRTWSNCWPICRGKCSRLPTVSAGSTNSGRPSERTKSMLPKSKLAQESCPP